MSGFKPKLEILPSAQKAVWSQLGFTSNDFVLYGGTALALRLGHRISEDFDFFSFNPLEPSKLQRSCRLLAEAEVLQWEPNTLSVLVHQGEHSVKLSFFGGLTFQQVEAPDVVEAGGCRIASLPDLFATKLNTIYQRAEAKDYLDIHAILSTGLTLRQGIDFARIVYGENFNAMLPLQALCYFEEDALKALPADVKNSLIGAVQSVSFP